MGSGKRDNGISCKPNSKTNNITDGVMDFLGALVTKRPPTLRCLIVVRLDSSIQGVSRSNKNRSKVSQAQCQDGPQYHRHIPNRDLINK